MIASSKSARYAYRCRSSILFLSIHRVSYFVVYVVHDNSNVDMDMFVAIIVCECELENSFFVKNGNYAK